MNDFDILCDIQLDTGTERVSIHGFNYDHPYSPQLSSVSDVVRSLPEDGRGYTTSRCSVDITDPRGHFSMLREDTTFKNRSVLLKLIHVPSGDTQTIFTGKIQDAAKDGIHHRLQLRDDTFDRLFRRRIPLRISKDLFTNLPTTTPLHLIPWVAGEVESLTKTGAIPAYLVDPAIGQNLFRYIAAWGTLKEITAVYRYGELVDPAFWSVTYANVTTEIGTIECTFIDFVLEQRERGRSFDIEITYDAKGVTDDDTTGGTLVENPAEIVEKFMLDSNLVTASELETIASTRYDDLSIKGSLVVSENMDTFEKVFDEFSKSFNLRLYKTGGGKFDLLFESGDTGAPVTTYSDSGGIIRDSFQSRGSRSNVSKLDYGYSFNFATSEFDNRRSQSDSSEQTRLGGEVEKEENLKFLGDRNAANVMTQIKLFYRSVQRRFDSVLVTPNLSLDLGSFVRITHYSGDGEIGYDRKLFQVRSIITRVRDDGVFFLLGMVDAPGLSPNVPADAEDAKAEIDIPQSSFDFVSDIEFSAPSDDQLDWTSGTITLSSGQEFSIASGNTGAIAATTYVYFDPDQSETVLQTSTMFSDAAGERKKLVAIVKPAADSSQPAPFKVEVGFDLPQTITKLSDLALDLGTITAGNWINADLQTNVNSNARYEFDDSGFSGHTSSTQVFSITRSASGGMLVTAEGVTYTFDADGFQTSLVDAGTVEAGTAKVNILTDDGAGNIDVQSSLFPSAGANIGNVNNVWGSAHIGTLITDSLTPLSGTEITIPRPAPASDNSGNVGTASLRYANGHFVTVNEGDTIYANGWRVREHPWNDELDELKNQEGSAFHEAVSQLKEGMEWIDPDGNLHTVIHRDGNIYTRGKILPLFMLP